MPSDTWKNGRWLVIDTETTGLHDPAIVELGAVIMQAGEVITHRCALFNPGKKIDPGAAAVHGIADEHVRTRPRITEPHAATGRTPAQGLIALCAEHEVEAIVGYNLISFDLPILRRELGADWQALEDMIGLVVDPLVLVRLESVGARWPGTGRHKLTAVADRLKLAGPEAGFEARAHRASWDCVLAGRILWRLRAHAPDDAADAGRFIAEQGAAQRAELDAYWARRNGAA